MSNPGKTGNLSPFQQMAGMGGLFGSMLGGGMTFKNPADAANPYLSQITGQVSPYFQPYIQAGQQALPQLQQQYGSLLNDPMGMMNKMGSGFQQSPGYQFQVDQATKAANNAASAGGMLGSPAEQQSLAGTVTGLANQDYYNALDHSMNLYGQGLTGMGNMAQMGYGAGRDLSSIIEDQLMSQAKLAYEGQNAKNQSEGGMFGGLGGLLGGAASLIPGGGALSKMFGIG
jgi:hypothetical protein